MARHGGADFATYVGAGITFAYPTNWQLEEIPSTEGASISLQSPGVSFAIVGVYDADVDPTNVVEEALASLREEHPALEAEELFEDEWPDGVTFEALFFSLDMVSYCWLHGWRLQDHTIFVMVQSIQPESDRGMAVFRALCRSIQPA